MSKLSPSELVFLRGAEFAPPAKKWEVKVTPLTGEGNVSATQLAQTALAVALLTNEEHTALELHEGEKRTKMGLSSAAALFASRESDTPEWPAGSLEVQILSVLDELTAGGKDADVSDIVYHLFDRDAPSPSGALLDMVNSALVDRGLVDETETKKWRFFTSKHYSLSEGTLSLIDEAEVADIHQTLQERQNADPEFWALLRAEIDAGISARLEADTDWD